MNEVQHTLWGPKIGATMMHDTVSQKIRCDWAVCGAGFERV